MINTFKVFTVFFIVLMGCIVTVDAVENTYYVDGTVVIIEEASYDYDDDGYVDAYEQDEFYEDQLPVNSVLENDELLELFNQDGEAGTGIQIQNGFHGR